jgi:hypothetical protein
MSTKKRTNILKIQTVLTAPIYCASKMEDTYRQIPQRRISDLDGNVLKFYSQPDVGRAA